MFVWHGAMSIQVYISGGAHCDIVFGWYTQLITSAMKIESAHFSKTLVSTNHSTWQLNPKEQNQNIRNLLYLLEYSHFLKVYFIYNHTKNIKYVSLLVVYVLYAIEHTRVHTHTHTHILIKLF